MKTIYLCSPRRLGELNYELIERIKKLGFNVLCAAIHTPQNIEPNKIFLRNFELIKNSDIFIAVLKDYGKDLTAETGIAFALGKPMIGIDFNANPEDIMSFHAFDKMIAPEKLEETLIGLHDLKTKMSLGNIGEKANEIEKEIGLTIDDSLNKLTQEVGEFNDSVQKFRGRYCKTRENNTEKIKEEAGDLFFNLISICKKLGINPDELPKFAENTLSKLIERKNLYSSNISKKNDL